MDAVKKTYKSLVTEKKNRGFKTDYLNASKCIQIP